MELENVDWEVVSGDFCGFGFYGVSAFIYRGRLDFCVKGNRYGRLSVRR